MRWWAGCATNFVKQVSVIMAGLVNQCQELLTTALIAMFRTTSFFIDPSCSNAQLWCVYPLMLVYTLSRYRGRPSQRPTLHMVLIGHAGFVSNQIVNGMCWHKVAHSLHKRRPSGFTTRAGYARDLFRLSVNRCVAALVGIKVACPSLGDVSAELWIWGPLKRRVGSYRKNGRPTLTKGSSAAFVCDHLSVAFFGGLSRPDPPDKPKASW